MLKRPLPCVLAVVLTAMGGAQAELRPEQVLVVANANAKGSEALGKYYCLSRGILAEQLLVLRTTAAPDVARDEYNSKIRDRIREHLKRNNLAGKIRCIVLVWGVPVRVLGTKMSKQQEDLVAAYRIAALRLSGRLGVNLKLLSKVGVTFPQPRTPTLTPVGELFEADLVANPPPSTTIEQLVADFAKQLKRSDKRASKLSNAQQRDIALRQLAAIRLDSYGAEGLLKYPGPTKVPQAPRADQLCRQVRSDAFELARLQAAKQTPQIARQTVEMVRRLRGVVGAHKYCRERMSAIDTAEEDASVDSELALLWEDGTTFRKWRPNPMNWRLAALTSKPAGLPKGIIMTARIDGPTAADALRIVKDSVAAEKTKLTGTFYIDAGGKYARYDKHLKRLAELVRKRTKIPVRYDKDKQLFAPDRCPNALLYVGWYSLQKYVPSFGFVRGAVGWHIASLEAVHLRVPASNEWCVKLIQNGIAATLGAVNEPYLGAFPPPDEFFALLLTGRFSVAECYWRTVPLVSWRMTLIADPLYNPFKLHPHLSIFDLPPQLGGWRRILSQPGPTSAPHVDTRPAS